MKRLKLINNYHDGLIREIRYEGDAEVYLDVDLFSGCKSCVERATLCLTSVRNFVEVKQALESARLANADRGYIDEIIGVVRADDHGQGYLIDLATAGGVYVNAKGIYEI